MDSPVAPFPCLAGRATFRSPSSFVFREFCSSLAAEAFIEVTCLLGDFDFISSVSPACCSERLNFFFGGLIFSPSFPFIEAWKRGRKTSGKHGAGAVDAAPGTAEQSRCTRAPSGVRRGQCGWPANLRAFVAARRQLGAVAPRQVHKQLGAVAPRQVHKRDIVSCFVLWACLDGASSSAGIDS